MRGAEGFMGEERAATLAMGPVSGAVWGAARGIAARILKYAEVIR